MEQKVTYELLIKDLASKGFIQMRDTGTQAFASVNNSVASTQNALSGLMTKIGLVGGAFAAIQGIKSIGKLGLDAEQTGVAFEVMLGSADKAKQMISDIRKLGAVTPFRSSELIDASQTLLNFGVQGEKVIDTLRMLGDTSGGNAEKMKRLSLAFGQAYAKGRLMGQETLQMVEAGFNPLQEISRTTGKSVAQLSKEMENGQISVEMMQNAFKTATSQGGRFYQMMDKQSKTVGGRLSTLQDNLEMIGMAIGNAMLPAIGNMVDFASAVLDRTASIRSALGNLVMAFSPITNAFESAFGGAITIEKAASNAVIFFRGIIESITPILQNMAVVLSPVVSWFIKLGQAIYVELAPTMQLISELFAQISPYLYEIITSITNAVNITFIAQTAFDTLRKVLYIVGQTFIFLAKVLTPILTLLIDISGYLITGAVGAWRVFSEFVMGIIEGIKWALDGITSVIYGIGEALGLVSGQASDFASKMNEAKGAGGGSFFFGEDEKGKPANTATKKAVEAQVSTLAPTAPQQQLAQTDSNLKAGIAGVQGDAKAARNITININNLINSLQVQSGMDLQGMETSVKDSALKGLMTALRDTSLMTGE